MPKKIVTRRLIEKRRRGIIGWIFLLIFWAYNALMLYSIAVGVASSGASGASAGFAIMVWLVFWAAGAVILGLMAHFTRGKREMVETEVRRS